MLSRPWFSVAIVWGAVPALWAGCDPSGMASSVAAATPAVTSSAQAVTADSWQCRGTPNNWGTTAMTATGGTLFTTCQTFGGVSNPRFKIDHFGDWAESYPAQDLPVANGSLQINFDAVTKQITTQAVASCAGVADSWQFRGTPNAWSTTAMTAIAGTSRFSIIADFAKQDPAPRFKIDHRGDWAESYPASDFGVIDCTEYQIVFDAATKQITTTARGTITSGACATTQPPPPPGADFREETIYFVMTARFFDGDPTNNYYNRDRIKSGDPQWRGDFKGLISQLDYIRGLGFTAIWVTPPVVNRSGLDYHGYHAYDWTKVDLRLESSGATYQDFITAAHAKGLKVVQDVVINHSSQYGIRGKVFIDHLPIKYYRPAGGAAISNGPYQGNLGDYLSAFREDNDNPVAPPWFVPRQTSDPAGTTPLVDPRTGVTVPLAGYDANRFFGVDSATLDPQWYHLDGFIAGGDWESPVPLQRKSIAGDAIDLATENQAVRDYLNSAIGRYLDMGVDAIRLDTLKHMERGDVLSYVNTWKARKPGLFVFGEDLVKGTGFGSELANDNASAVIRPWWYTRLTTNRPARTAAVTPACRCSTSRCSRRSATTSTTARSAASAACSPWTGSTATRPSWSRSSRTTTSARTTTSSSGSMERPGRPRAPTTSSGRSAGFPACTRARRSSS
jgi:hypothetical protein